MTKKDRISPLENKKKVEELDENMSKTIRAVSKSIIFFTPAFILNTKLPDKGQP